MGNARVRSCLVVVGSLGMSAGLAAGTSPAVHAADTPLLPGALILASIAVDGSSDPWGLSSEAEEMSLSADGTRVAFEAVPTSGEDPTVGQVYVKDLVTGDLVLVSARGLEPGDGHSGDPRITADGTKVIFESAATNLHDDDNDAANDVYLKDLGSGVITLVSVGVQGKGNGESENADVSDDGTAVAFESVATNLAGEELIDLGDNPRSQVYVRNLETGETRLISRDSTGPGSFESDDPSLSGDGTVVAFQSNSVSLPLANGFNQVYVAELTSGGGPELASSEADGTPGGRGSENPDLSADGSSLVFQSRAPNFPGQDPDPDAAEELIYLKDLRDGTLWLVSTGSGGPANAGSENPVISADGSVVAFESRATNLLPDQDPEYDVFVSRDGTLALASADIVGNDGATDDFAMSSDASTIAYRTWDALDPLDTDGVIADVYVKVVAAGTATVVGTVRDSFSAAPIEGACVTFTDGVTNSGPVCTGADGTYQSPVLPRGVPYDVAVVGPTGGSYLDADSGVEAYRGAQSLDLELQRDVDGDGQADEEQPNAQILQSPVSDDFLTVTWSDGVVDNVEASGPVADPPLGYALPHGLLSFEVSGVVPGATVTITVYLESTAGIIGYAKYHDDTWSILPAEFVDVFEDRVEVALTDGGVGDDDGVENGIIVDPGGVVTARGPGDVVDELRVTLDGMPLHHGTKNALGAQLGRVEGALEAGGSTTSACNALRAFSNHVRAQTGTKVSTAQAAILDGLTASIRAALGCT